MYLKKIVIASFLTLALFSHIQANENNYIDLGVYSEQYEIEELSLFEDLKDRYKKVDKDFYIKQLESTFQKSMEVDYGVPTCTETKKRMFEPLVQLSENIYEPYTNKIMYFKGQKINLLKQLGIGMGKYILFVDESDEVQKTLSYMYNKRANVYLVKGNVKNLLDIGVENASKVPFKEVIETFGIKCVPSFYTQQDDKFIINEYNPNDLEAK